MGKRYKEEVKRRMYLKVKSKELWISPAGREEEYFLTDKKITMKKIKNWQPQKNRLF